MDQPTAKKSKRMEAGDGDTFSSVKSAGVFSDAEEMDDVQDENYFTPALMDVWPSILAYLTDPKDVYSMMNASTLFHDLLEKRKASALLPLVLPILMKQEPYPFMPNNYFNFRLTSKQVKASVDDTLDSLVLDDRSWLFWFREGISSLMSPDEMEEFFDVITPEFNGNPFLGRHCSLLLDEDLYLNCLEALRRYGHELYSASFSIGVYEASPRGAVKALKRALRYLPNLKSLHLTFSDIEFEDEEALKNYSANLHHLPALKSLTKLELTYDIDNDDMNPPPPSLLKPILHAYGNQLTSLSLESYVFRGNSRRSLSFPNLLHFRAVFPADESSASLKQIYKNLAKLCCPNLESLTFTGETLELTADTFLVLNNFRSSLKRLHFEASWGTGNQMFQVDPSDIQEFPQLTCLILCMSDTKTPARHLFVQMFTKLKELKFETSEPERFIDQHVSNAQDLLDENVRRRYFVMFTELRRITWIRKEYLLGHAVCKETVFTRPNKG